MQSSGAPQQAKENHRLVHDLLGNDAGGKEARAPALTSRAFETPSNDDAGRDMRLLAALADIVDTEYGTLAGYIQRTVPAPPRERKEGLRTSRPRHVAAAPKARGPAASSASVPAPVHPCKATIVNFASSASVPAPVHPRKATIVNLDAECRSPFSPYSAHVCRACNEPRRAGGTMAMLDGLAVVPICPKCTEGLGECTKCGRSPATHQAAPQEDGTRPRMCEPCWKIELCAVVGGTRGVRPQGCFLCGKPRLQGLMRCASCTPFRAPYADKTICSVAECQWDVETGQDKCILCLGTPCSVGCGNNATVRGHGKSVYCANCYAAKKCSVEDCRNIAKKGDARLCSSCRGAVTVSSTAVARQSNGGGQVILGELTSYPASTHPTVDELLTALLFPEVQSSTASRAGGTNSTTDASQDIWSILGHTSPLLDVVDADGVNLFDIQDVQALPLFDNVLSPLFPFPLQSGDASPFEDASARFSSTTNSTTNASDGWASPLRDVLSTDGLNLFDIQDVQALPLLDDVLSPLFPFPLQSGDASPFGDASARFADAVELAVNDSRMPPLSTSTPSSSTTGVFGGATSSTRPQPLAEAGNIRKRKRGAKQGQTKVKSTSSQAPRRKMAEVEDVEGEPPVRPRLIYDRRYTKRKKEEKQGLERDVQPLRDQVQVWRARADDLKKLVEGQGVAVVPFDDMPVPASAGALEGPEDNKGPENDEGLCMYSPTHSFILSLAFPYLGNTELTLNFVT
ncbi:hypothetical protein C8J57DRAFT_267100 [Mycena rebaudengoi]|nr:hypothetical protein C8J57DRAFT_267100 [Mycena rebaudengoi]